MWRLANIDVVVKTAPDLILRDYTSNDLLGGPGDIPYVPNDLSMDQHLNRAVAADLARALLSIPSRPAVIFLMLLRHFSGPDSHYDSQATDFEPVARAFGLTLVSYRDAIWPTERSPPDKSRHLFDCGITIHPVKHVLQLIADSGTTDVRREGDVPVGRVLVRHIRCGW